MTLGGDTWVRVTAGTPRGGGDTSDPRGDRRDPWGDSSDPGGGDMWVWVTFGAQGDTGDLRG